MADLLTAALGYAGAGWAVFPCAPGAKVPLYASPHPAGSPERDTCRGECGRWGHGVLDADTDPATVTTWWKRTPTANIGIATGAPGPDVVDFDTKGGKPGLATLDRLSEAGLLRGARWLVRTPSGGIHLYFRGTQQGNGALARHGVDFRGAGGYVLAPPSTVNGQPYVLVEHRGGAAGVDWSAIRQFLNPPRPTPTRRPSHGDHSALTRWVADQAAGNRNEGLYWATRRAIEDGAAPQVLAELAAAAVSAGLSPSEAERTVQSAQRRAEIRR